MDSANPTKSAPLSEAAFPIEHSNIYTVWLAQKEEIARHKWVLSERVGHDVGWEAAKWDWDMHHRQQWIREMKERGMWPK
jgi:hypothetical protein